MAFLSDNYDRNRYREPLTLFVGPGGRAALHDHGPHPALPGREGVGSVDRRVQASTPIRTTPGSGRCSAARSRASTTSRTGAATTDLVADHVTSFRLQYWDAKRKDWVREWTTRPTEHQKELPQRVRVELEMALADGRTEKFVTEARIELRRYLGTD